MEIGEEMTTKFFNNWTEANTYYRALAHQAGYAYSIEVDFVDALIDGDEVKNIIVTDDHELATLFGRRGYEVGSIRADDWEVG
jgi:hypothetical protein